MVITKIVVLGGYGEMGQVISRDLSETAKKFQIVIAGRDRNKAAALAKSFKKRNVVSAGVDAADKQQMKRLLRGAKVLINATNYYSNVKVMEAALYAGVHYVDLGGLYHVTLKQLKLNSMFKKKKLIAVIGCGSTPGITNLMAHYGAERLKRIDSIEIAFADKDYTDYRGLPFVVPYSMYTVFDEFTKRPAVFRNGKMEFAKPLSGEKSVDFPEPVGRVQCRYSLHSELATFPERFKEKGLRNCSFRGGWDPDFVKQVKFLISTGFASVDQIVVKGAKVVPRDVTVALLNKFIPSNKIKIDDIEILKVELIGSEKSVEKRIVMYCKAKTNKKWNISAGSWDTGVPPSIMAQLIAAGKITAHGVLPPGSEHINPKEFFRELKKRGIEVYIEKEDRI